MKVSIRAAHHCPFNTKLNHKQTYIVKLTTKLHLALALAAGMFTTTTYAGPSGPWPPNFPTRVTTMEQAKKCCVPGARVALACKDCKTINEKDGADKKGILSWFKPESKHGCSGCGGHIVVSQVGGGKSQSYTYKHTCSKCGKDSAFACSTHSKFAS